MNISIAVCTYNGERYIKEQIDSLIKQSMPPDEIVVCDDASTDGTVDIVDSLLSAWGGRYKIIRNEKNIGYIKNFEKAIKACDGEYIFLCDQDDVWSLDKILKVMRVFRKYPDTGMVFHDAYLVDANLDSLGRTFWEQSKFFDDNPKKHIIYDNGNVVQGAASAIRREIFERSYPFPKDEYHDKWLAITAILTSKLRPLNEPLILYRQHGYNALGAFGKPKKEEKKMHSGFKKRQQKLAKNNMDSIDNKINFYSRCVYRFYPKYKNSSLNDLRKKLFYLRMRRKFIMDRKFWAILKLYKKNILDNYKFRNLRHDFRAMIILRASLKTHLNSR